MKKILSVAAVFTAMLCLNGVGFAEELAAMPVAEPVNVEVATTETTMPVAVLTPDATVTTAAPDTTATTTTETVGGKFASRERLRNTLMEQLRKLETDGATTTAAIDAARVDTFVANLSTEQVFALNRSLNNAVQQRLALNYDLELLERIVTDKYGKQQINALTKGLEEEAKFQALYERTGNKKFLEQAESQKEKFLAKVDRLSRDTTRTATRETTRNTLRAEIKSDAAEATQSAVKEQAKVEARRMAKEAVKAEAKTMAKVTADETAKGLAREAALASAREESKQLARNSAQEAAKDVAKQSAEEVAKEVGKENQWASAKAMKNE